MICKKCINCEHYKKHNAMINSTAEKIDKIDNTGYLKRFEEYLDSESFKKLDKFSQQGIYKGI